MLKIAIAVLLLSLPVAAQEWEPPTASEWAVVGVAAAASVMDVLQTSDCLYHNRSWCYEQNPLLGRHPSRGRLWGTMAGGLVLMSTAFYMLPPKWRTILPACVAGVEIAMVFHNAADNHLSLAFRF